MSLWNRFVAHLAREEPATPMALFRIAVGLVVLGTMITSVTSGSAEVLWVTDADGGYNNFHSKQWIVRLLGGHTAEHIWLILGVCTVASIGVITGTLTRVSALVCGQTFLALMSLAPGTGGSHDRVIQNALWLLVLIPAGSTLSVDCRLRTGRWRDDTLRPAWGRTLIVFQLCLIYTSAGLHKLGVSWFPWGGYLAVHQSLLNPVWSRLDLQTLPLLGYFSPLTRLSTAISWIWEVTFAVSAWWLGTGRAERRLARLGAHPSWMRRLRDPDIRWLYLIIGMLMHGTLLVFMELGPFSLITMSFYFGLFRHHELARWLPGGAPRTDST